MYEGIWKNNVTPEPRSGRVKVATIFTLQYLIINPYFLPYFIKSVYISYAEFQIVASTASMLEEPEHVD